MLHDEQWKNEIERRNSAFSKGTSEEFMTREVFEWNEAFMAEYYQLRDWTSEDGEHGYTEKAIMEKLGFSDRRTFRRFVMGIREQMRNYTLEWFKELKKAGRTDAEIAEEMSITENQVRRMRMEFGE